MILCIFGAEKLKSTINEGCDFCRDWELVQLYVRIYLILEWCCVAPLAVVPGRAAPLGVEN